MQVFVLDDRHLEAADELREQVVERGREHRDDHDSTHTMTKPMSVAPRSTSHERKWNFWSLTRSPMNFSTLWTAPTADAIHHSTTPAMSTTISAQR